MNLLAGAWTADVIWYLREGERCFTELQHDLRGVSAKVLTTRLRKLEREGVIERISRRTSPPTVWYALTPLGQELFAALSLVIDIGQRLKQSRQAGFQRIASSPVASANSMSATSKPALP